MREILPRASAERGCKAREYLSQWIESLQQSRTRRHIGSFARADTLSHLQYLAQIYFILQEIRQMVLQKRLISF
jgi:hypothetical protein